MGTIVNIIRPEMVIVGQKPSNWRVAGSSRLCSLTRWFLLSCALITGRNWNKYSPEIQLTLEEPSGFLGCNHRLARAAVQRQHFKQFTAEPRTDTFVQSRTAPPYGLQDSHFCTVSIRKGRADFGSLCLQSENLSSAKPLG